MSSLQEMTTEPEEEQVEFVEDKPQEFYIQPSKRNPNRRGEFIVLRVLDNGKDISIINDEEIDTDYGADIAIDAIPQLVKRLNTIYEEKRKNK
jgi:hypothetical protein